MNSSGSSLAHAQEAQADQASAEAANPNDTSSVTERAREHFERGVDYYGEGDYRAALIEFQRAYSIQPTYRLLYNLGQVAYELRDYAAKVAECKTFDKRAKAYTMLVDAWKKGIAAGQYRVEVTYEAGKTVSGSADVTEGTGTPVTVRTQ